MTAKEAMKYMDIELLTKVLTELLSDLMKAKEYSIADLSAIKRRTINGWLLLKHSPQIGGLYKLGEFFRCSVDYFLGKKAFNYK